jgi:hypothetical protein
MTRGGGFGGSGGSGRLYRSSGLGRREGGTGEVREEFVDLFLAIVPSDLV